MALEENVSIWPRMRNGNPTRRARQRGKYLDNKLVEQLKAQRKEVRTKRESKVVVSVESANGEKKRGKERITK